MSIETENGNELLELTSINLPQIVCAIISNHADILSPGNDGNWPIPNKLQEYIEHLESRNALSLPNSESVLVTLGAIDQGFLDYISEVIGFGVNHVRVTNFSKIFSDEFKSKYPNFVLDPYTQDTYLAQLALLNDVSFRYSKVEDLMAGAASKANDKAEFERICQELEIKTIPNKTIININSLANKLDVLEKYLLEFGSCFISNNRSGGGMGNEVLEVREIRIPGFDDVSYIQLLGKGIGKNSSENSLDFQTLSDLESYIQNILRNTFLADSSFFASWRDSNCSEIIIAPKYNIQEGPSVYFEIYPPEAGQVEPRVEILGTFGQILNPNDNNACIGMRYPNPAAKYDEQMIAEATKYAKYVYKTTGFCGRANMDYAIIIHPNNTKELVAIESNARYTAVQPALAASQLTGRTQEFWLIDHLHVPRGYKVAEIMKYLQENDIQLLGNGKNQSKEFGACATTQINQIKGEMAMVYVGSKAEEKMAKIQKLLYTLPNK